MHPKISILLCIVSMSSCSQQSAGTQKQLEARIDSLQKIVDHSYKPGLGEFMSGIQLHHERLWFAGKNKNWALAGFEINEIREALTDISDYCKDRPETRFLPMISPSLDSLDQSIQQKNSNSFQRYYIALTGTCNSCHQATRHAFNTIKVPGSSPFSDQEFSIPGQRRK
jgi:hypothetical protein